MRSLLIGLISFVAFSSHSVSKVADLSVGLKSSTQAVEILAVTRLPRLAVTRLPRLNVSEVPSVTRLPRLAVTRLPRVDVSEGLSVTRLPRSV